MARVYAGEVLGLVKPAAGQTTELMVFLQDATGAALTSQAFNAAGMEVYISKPGAADVIWATIVGNAFATGNWSERGHGKYVIILSGDVAGEANLLDTPGDIAVYVKNTASKGDNFLFRVVPADVVRDDVWTDTKAGYVDASVAAANNGTPPTAQAIATYVWATNATGAAVAATLAGITSLAAWLRGLYRKDAMDATAKSEVNTSGGTYNEATDSNEAIRDRGDAAWVTATGFAEPGDEMALTDGAVTAVQSGLALEDTAQSIKDVTDTLAGAAVDGVFTAEALQNAPTGAGQGPRIVTVTVADVATVFEGVRVAATNADGTLEEIVLTTNTYGQVEFHLDSDDWTFVASENGAQGGGHTHATITTNQSVTIAVTETPAPAPAPAGYCAVRCVVETQFGAVENVGTFSFAKLYSPETRDASGVTVRVVEGDQTVDLDADGIGTLNLLQGATVAVRVTTNREKIVRKIVVPDTSNADLWDIAEVA